MKTVYSHEKVWLDKVVDGCVCSNSCEQKLTQATELQ